MCNKQNGNGAALINTWASKEKKKKQARMNLTHAANQTTYEWQTGRKIKDAYATTHPSIIISIGKREKQKKDEIHVFFFDNKRQN
jgi:hypothetical protein